jgi:hypothetical protein
MRRSNSRFQEQLMSIHERMPPKARKELKEVRWTKGLELAKVARRDKQDSRSRGGSPEMICADWGANFDNGNPETLLFSMTRFFKFFLR